MEQNNLYDLETMLNEAKAKLERQFKSISTFRDHAKTIFSASSVIVALFSVLKTTNIPQERVVIYVVGWVLIALLYISLTIAEIKTIFPKEILGPIEATWKEYEKAFYGKEKEDILLQQITNYLNVIGMNQEVVNKQKKWSLAICTSQDLI
jgi:hypothetical protein